MKKKIVSFLFRHAALIAVLIALTVIAIILIYSMNASMSRAVSSPKTPVVQKVQTEPEDSYRIDGVIAVKVNTDDYSVLYKDGKEIKLQHVHEWMPWIKKKKSESGQSLVFKTYIFEDASPGKMYVEIEWWNNWFCQAVIHVDDARTAFIK